MEDNSSENVTFRREIRDAQEDGATVGTLHGSVVIGYDRRCRLDEDDIIADAIEDFTIAVKIDRITTLRRLLKCAGLKRDHVDFKLSEVYTDRSLIRGAGCDW
ncbi:hypothetical protein QE152_g6896 [Popillia japonica]|uniref:Uncharacterized protein n=1 Tax=Popillia japonica TaxID=7064 RepID=A0AAW1MIK5_POPJA